MEKHYYVYILTTQNNTTMYIGVTNDLHRRILEHKDRMASKFTAKYNIDKLVYFEQTSDVLSALNREKEIKHWRRKKKNKLVSSQNPMWDDLTTDIGL
jgi:putative endonuclease